MSLRHTQTQKNGYHHLETCRSTFTATDITAVAQNKKPNRRTGLIKCHSNDKYKYWISRGLCCCLCVQECRKMRLKTALFLELAHQRHTHTTHKKTHRTYFVSREIWTGLMCMSKKDRLNDKQFIYKSHRKSVKISIDRPVWDMNLLKILLVFFFPFISFHSWFHTCFLQHRVFFSWLQRKTRWWSEARAH